MPKDVRTLITLFVVAGIICIVGFQILIALAQGAIS